jgi:hypothetical protein
MLGLSADGIYRIAEIHTTPGQVRPANPQNGTSAFLYIPLTLVITVNYADLFTTV